MKVRNATEEYFDEVDHVMVWRDECLAETGETTVKELYASFKLYSEEDSRKPLTERSFFLWMTRHYDKRRTSKGVYYPVMVK